MRGTRRSTLPPVDHAEAAQLPAGDGRLPRRPHQALPRAQTPQHSRMSRDYARGRGQTGRNSDAAPRVGQPEGLEVVLSR